MNIIDYSPELSSTGNATEYINLDAILLSIRSILITPLGSRPFQPNYGCNLYKYIFEPLDSITEEVREEIIRALTVWEPRVPILDSILIPSPKTKTISIAITFLYNGQKTTRKLIVDQFDFLNARPAR